MNNKYVKSASDLVTTHEVQRAGFLEYALRKSKESIPYIDKAKSLRAILKKQTKKPSDILGIEEIKSSCFEAAGVSVKANRYLSDKDLEGILAEFIKEFLEPAGKSYIDELIYRYLLTCGDALGGRMRNLVGAMANEKLTRHLISQLQVLSYWFRFYDKSANKWLSSDKYDLDKVSDIRAIQWKHSNGNERQVVYNLTIPIVRKNIDLVILSQHCDKLAGSEFKSVISDVHNYCAIGELKGGIDPAGADEHWKTANTALSRVRDSFKKQKVDIPLVFIGAAIETSMSKEIFNQYKTGKLQNCANLTVEEQLIDVCNWLVSC